MYIDILYTISDILINIKDTLFNIYLIWHIEYLIYIRDLI